MLQKLKDTGFLAKVNTICSWFWSLGTVAFLTVIFISTKGFTIDPCYGEGCPEYPYLIPMLLFLFVGSSSFSLMVTSGILKRVLKAKPWKSPLGLGSWRVGLVTLLAVLISGVYIFASFRNSVMWGGSYSGNDLFNSVNEHRKSIGLSEVQLSEGLCDNLVSRWQAVKDDRQHEGFEDWVVQEGIQTNYGYKEVAELYVQAPTPSDAIAFWVSSPGHKIQLENPKWTDGCAYASEGSGVVVMSYK